MPFSSATPSNDDAIVNGRHVGQVNDDLLRLLFLVVRRNLAFEDDRIAVAAADQILNRMVGAVSQRGTDPFLDGSIQDTRCHLMAPFATPGKEAHSD